MTSYQVSEKNMHIVRWLLSVGWLTLIVSLFLPQLSAWLTDASNTLSPFHLHPEICVHVQGKCLPSEAYGLGARIFWAVVLPIGIMILLVGGHEVWRRICPLYFFSQIPRALGIQRKRKETSESGTPRYELAGVEKESWLGRNYLYLQFGLFYLGLNIRILFVNGDHQAMAVFLLFTIASAITVGFLFKGRSWCQYFCPMAPVQMFYTGPRGLLGTHAHLSPPQSITQSMCRSIDGSGKEKVACVSCQSPCIDIDVERSYWEGITRHDQKLLFYGYFGLMFGFYCYYFLYSGGWEYYYSGAWTHEEGQLKTLFNPGFYIFGHAIPIPKLIAAPLTIALFTAFSYGIGSLVESLYRKYLKSKDKYVNEEQLLHVLFMVSTFISFNVFFTFGGRPNIALLPEWAQLFLNAIIVSVSSLWLYRSLDRSKDKYTRESLAGSLRRNLSKLGVDCSKFLEGRSLQSLLPDEVYVLAKVLPGFSHQDKLSVYKGILQESLEDGETRSADSLEVLEDVRKQLNVSDKEHYSVLSQLGVEDPELLDPQKQLSRENTLRLEGYSRGLDLLIQELIQSGKPIDQLLDIKRKQIQVLRQEFAITHDEHEQVYAQIVRQDGPLLKNATLLLEQLESLAVRAQLLRKFINYRQAPVYLLLRNSVLEKQKLITGQLLTILNMLGDNQDALEIARHTGVFANEVISQILNSYDENTRWESRLATRIINALKQQTNGSGSNSVTSGSLQESYGCTKFTVESNSGSSRLRVTQLPSSGRHPEINEVLLEMLHDIDPLVQVGSLYALWRNNQNLGVEQANNLLNDKSTKDWLLLETANKITGSEASVQSREVAKLIVRKQEPGHSEKRYEFLKNTITIGREPDSDIVFIDRRVSRRHAILHLEPQSTSVQDLSSSNGLWVGNTRELIRGQLKQLRREDDIYLNCGGELSIHVSHVIENLPTNQTTDGALPGTFEKLLWLYQSNLFSGVNANALIRLAQNATIRSYRPEENICILEAPAKTLFVLIEGEARVIKSHIINNNPKWETIAAGQSIGELEVFNHTNYAVNAIASGVGVKALLIDANDFETVLSQDSLLSRNILKILSSRLLQP
jgi:FHA domain/Cyclic nucleotide-binding domain